MNGLGYTWQTITWRVAGLITALTLFYLWLITGQLWMAGLGFVGFGFVGFAGSWSIAAWLDVHTVCCTETRPHTRWDYGEGEHWVTEDVT